ncbi:MAG: hypothetical protein AAB451_04245, partial [Patescibacteria group bacterium]
EKLEIVSPFGSKTLKVEDGAAPSPLRIFAALRFVEAASVMHAVGFLYSSRRDETCSDYFKNIAQV